VEHEIGEEQITKLNVMAIFGRDDAENPRRIRPLTGGHDFRGALLNKEGYPLQDIHIFPRATVYSGLLWVAAKIPRECSIAQVNSIPIIIRPGIPVLRLGVGQSVKLVVGIPDRLIKSPTYNACLLGLHVTTRNIDSIYEYGARVTDEYSVVKILWPKRPKSVPMKK
jgi:hypothetical protein